MCIIRVVNGRHVQHAGASRRALVEELRHNQPDLLCGLLNAPATHVGTTLEREFFDTISELFGQQVAGGRSILFLGRSQNRLADQTCMKNLLEDKKVWISHVQWCCLGIKQVDTHQHPCRRHQVVSNFVRVPACRCKSSPVPSTSLSDYSAVSAAYGATYDLLLPQFSCQPRDSGHVNESVSVIASKNSQLSGVPDLHR